jgi:hypothetical protein
VPDERDLLDHLVGDAASGALSVIDLVALAPGDDALVVEARQRKAGWCDVLAGQTRVFVS